MFLLLLKITLKDKKQIMGSDTAFEGYVPSKENPIWILGKKPIIAYRGCIFISHITVYFHAEIMHSVRLRTPYILFTYGQVGVDLLTICSDITAFMKAKFITKQLRQDFRRGYTIKTDCRVSDAIAFKSIDNFLKSIPTEL